jgi:hypothetical protein
MVRRDARDDKHDDLDEPPQERHPSAVSVQPTLLILARRKATHVDIVNPPAEYTAASEKPTMVPDMSATSAEMADMTRGNTTSGQNGGRFRLSRLRARSVPASEGGGLSMLCSGAALSR